MSEYFDPEAKTIKVKIPAYTVEVDIAVWAATYGIYPEFDQTMIQKGRAPFEGHGHRHAIRPRQHTIRQPQAQFAEQELFQGMGSGCI